MVLDLYDDFCSWLLQFKVVRAALPYLIGLQKMFP